MPQRGHLSRARTPKAMLGLLLACAITIFSRFGTYVPTLHLHGPGLVLDGGGGEEAPNSSLRWLHDRLVGATGQRGGNVLVLRAYDNNYYDRPFYKYGNFASVQTVLIPPCTPRAQVDSVARLIDRADAVFFSGGDQADYVAWKGSQLIAAVKRVYARGGVVGGGSAGLAIQGAVIYDSVAGDRMNVETHTADAVANPLEKRISFTTGFFSWPALANTITDTHLVVRNRLGRTVVFLARILEERLLPTTPPAYALGVDQASSVVVDSDGNATVLNGPGGKGAYLMRADNLPDLEPGKPLNYTVSVSHVGRDGEHFDLLHKQTQDPWFSLTVDGSRTPIYSRDPYSP